MPTYNQVITDLRQAYDGSAGRRDEGDLQEWKLQVRQHFADLLRREGKQNLLEIGAGPGKFGLFFKEQGLHVVCTDLSPEMVRLCQQKGLTAHVMDFLHLDFPAGSFDAVFALNCLLHVPKAELPIVLESIRRVLQPGGLFYMGVYGGNEFEGIRPNDDHVPKRFFALYTHDQMRDAVSKVFEIVIFDVIPMQKNADGSPANYHFQSMILRRPLHDDLSGVA